MRPAAGLHGDQALGFVDEVFQHLGAFDLHIHDLAGAHVLG
jgi:hypothetical protein